MFTSRQFLDASITKGRVARFTDAGTYVQLAPHHPRGSQCHPGVVSLYISTLIPSLNISLSLSLSSCLLL